MKRYVMIAALAATIVAFTAHDRAGAMTVATPLVASASGVLGLPPVLLPNLRILDGVGISPLLSPLGLLPPLGLAAPLVVTESANSAHAAGRSAIWIERDAVLFRRGRSQAT